MYRGKCANMLGCGHACPGRCDQPCSAIKCTKIIDRLFDAPCGHKVQLPCHVYSSMMNGGIEPKTLLAHCQAPCGEQLCCGHSCGGSCAACHQGRLHAACTNACHQQNICGHRCEEPCHQVCPPCPRPCEVRCEHSPCGKMCGAPCSPRCSEPCKRACKHSACKRLCGAPCDRAPCEEPCPLMQYCGHPCHGLCGEPCPKACRQCDPDNFPTDLLGDPYEDGVKLVQLQDCPHIMDVATLDGLMRSQSETVQVKPCPFCRQPIINTHRYKDLVNRLVKHEIHPIIEKIYKTRTQKKKTEMLLKVDGIIKALTGTAATENGEWMKSHSKINKVIKSLAKDKKVSLQQLEMYDVYLNTLKDVGDYCVKYEEANITKLGNEFRDQVKLICEVLAANVHKISQQQQVDIANELRRMNSIIQYGKIVSQVRNISLKTTVARAAKAGYDAVFTWRVFDEEAAVESLKKLEAAVKMTGSWFKCPNGDIFCSSGSLELGLCPICGVALGGHTE